MTKSRHAQPKRARKLLWTVPALIACSAGAIAAGQTPAEPTVPRQASQVAPQRTQAAFVPSGEWTVENTSLTVVPAPPTPEEIAAAQAIIDEAVRVAEAERQAAERAQMILVSATYTSGTVPVEMLCPLSFAPAHKLRCDAAEALERAYADGMPIDKMSDSYRSLDAQIATKRNKPFLAATPGMSMHGLGIAIDTSGAMQAWLHENGARYGWINPDWAKGAKYEPWHFEFQSDIPLPEFIPVYLPDIPTNIPDTPQAPIPTEPEPVADVQD